MKIDYEKTEQISESFLTLIKGIEKQKEVFDSALINLSENTQLEQVIIEMKNTSKKFEQEIYFLKQIQKALFKVSVVYSEAENRINTNIDSNWKVKKQAFTSGTDIAVSTDFSWRIE